MVILGPSQIPVGFSPSHLARFLLDVVVVHSVDSEIIASATAEYEALTKVENASGNGEDKGLSPSQLASIKTLINGFLIQANSIEIPPLSIYEAHSMKGSIESLQGMHSSAVESYIKALWIVTSTAKSSASMTETAHTLHHLGMAYFFMRSYHEARRIINRAIVAYEESGSRSDQPNLNSAHRLLKTIARKIDGSHDRYHPVFSSSFLSLHHSELFVIDEASEMFQQA